jgi:hypothetical protein
MAFSLFGKPFGYAAGGRVQAPRTTNIADQHHKLAYINNEEEALLRARGGTGQAGPGGIPAFPPVKGKTRGKSNAGTGFSGGSGGGAVAVAAVLTRGRQIIPLPAAATITIAAVAIPAIKPVAGTAAATPAATLVQALPHLHLQAQAKRK